MTSTSLIRIPTPPGMGVGRSQGCTCRKKCSSMFTQVMLAGSSRAFASTDQDRPHSARRTCATECRGRLAGYGRDQVGQDKLNGAPQECLEREDGRAGHPNLRRKNLP